MQSSKHSRQNQSSHRSFIAARGTWTARASSEYRFKVARPELGLQSGRGFPLPLSLKNDLEEAIDEALPEVIIHEGLQAEQLGATAFTVDSHIYFAPGRFQPTTPMGLHLLAHEVAHVIQGREHRVKALPGVPFICLHSPQLEAEADTLAWRAVANILNLKLGLSFAKGQKSCARMSERTSSSAGACQVLQRKLYVGSDSYTTIDRTLNALVDELFPYAATSNKSELDQTLTRFDFQNRRFTNKLSLMRAVNYVLLHERLEDAKPIPKYLHHFWTGGALSTEARANLQLWLARANAAGWFQYILTDSQINAHFSDKLAKDFEILREGGSVIVDVSQLPFANKETYNSLKKLVIGQNNKSKLPYISDLARYAQLLALGGLYVDVDVSPGTVDMNSALQCIRGIPQLGPCLRTTADAKRLGMLEPLEIIRVAAMLSLFSKDKLAIGNHFIAAPPQNSIVSRANEIAAKNLKEAEVTNGGLDMLKAFSAVGGLGLDGIPASLPAWAMNVEWVTPESDSIVD